MRRRSHDLPARDVSKGHRWCLTDLFAQPSYCNISDEHIVSGAFCDLCGTCVSRQNMRQADKSLACKALSAPAGVHVHHWVRGNLSLASVCAVCQGAAGDQPVLADYKCCWCWRVVHEA